MNSEKCLGCRRGYPAHLLHDLEVGVVGGSSRTELRCPICALAVKNAVDASPPGTPFRGPKAKRLYEEAVAWVRKTGQKLPDWEEG